MKSNEKYANSLMDAIGKIDDKYIVEAQYYTPKKRLPSYVRGAIGLAASLLIVMTAVIPLYLFGRIGKNTATDSRKAGLALRAEMYSALMNSTAKSYTEPPETDGAALVWQTEGDMEYHVIPIDDRDGIMIMSAIGKPVAEPEKNGVRIWVVNEEGLYMTPELIRSDGNTDVKAFDYLPELQITDGTASLILNIVKEKEK